MRCATMLAVAGAIWIGGGAAAQDPLPLTGELIVNGFTAGNQFDPAVGMAANGTHVVVWTSAGQDGDGSGVRRRRFPADGSAPFNEGPLNDLVAGDQVRPAIGMNATGDWTAVWDIVDGGAGIRARRATNGGTTIGAEFAASQVLDYVLVPDTSRADDGGFVVSWQLGANTHIRRFDAAGAALSGDQDITPGPESSRRPRVAHVSGGGFVVSFHDADGDGYGPYFRRFDEEGVGIGGAEPASETVTGAQQETVVAGEAGGGFVLAWKVTGDGSRLRRFDGDGFARGPEAPVGGTAQADGVEVATSPAGGFVVAFRDSGVWAREFDRLGRPVGGPFQVDTATSVSIGSLDVGAGADRFVVVWFRALVSGDSDVVRRLYRFRSIFADDFEIGDTDAWETSP